jgi:hypothetical protein
MQDHTKKQAGDRQQGQYASKSCGGSMSEWPGIKSHEMNDVRHEGLVITRNDPPGPSTGTGRSTVGSQASKGSECTGIKVEPS